MQQALAALVLATAKGHELLFVSQSTPPTAFFDRSLRGNSPC